MEPNETICLQFWYHMHGLDTGNLSVYLKTDQSESLVWRLSGENGNRWRFGQAALNSQNYYKVSNSKLHIQSPLVAHRQEGYIPTSPLQKVSDVTR